MSLPITVRLSRFEGSEAILATDSGHEFAWPKEHLPAGASDASLFRFDLARAASTLIDAGIRERLAKAIVNELLAEDVRSTVTA